MSSKTFRDKEFSEGNELVYADQNQDAPQHVVEQFKSLNGLLISCSMNFVATNITPKLYITIKSDNETSLFQLDFINLDKTAQHLRTNVSPILNNTILLNKDIITSYNFTKAKTYNCIKKKLTVNFMKILCNPTKSCIKNGKMINLSDNWSDQRPVAFVSYDSSSSLYFMPPNRCHCIYYSCQIISIKTKTVINEMSFILPVLQIESNPYFFVISFTDRHLVFNNLTFMCKCVVINHSNVLSKIILSHKIQASTREHNLQYSPNRTSLPNKICLICRHTIDGFGNDYGGYNSDYNKQSGLHNHHKSPLSIGFALKKSCNPGTLGLGNWFAISQSQIGQHISSTNTESSLLNDRYGVHSSPKSKSRNDSLNTITPRGYMPKTADTLQANHINRCHTTPTTNGRKQYSIISEEHGHRNVNYLTGAAKNLTHKLLANLTEGAVSLATNTKLYLDTALDSRANNQTESSGNESIETKCNPSNLLQHPTDGLYNHVTIIDVDELVKCAHRGFYVNLCESNHGRAFEFYDDELDWSIFCRNMGIVDPLNATNHCRRTIAPNTIQKHVSKLLFNDQKLPHLDDNRSPYIVANFQALPGESSGLASALSKSTSTFIKPIYKTLSSSLSHPRENNREVDSPTSKNNTSFEGCGAGSGEQITHLAFNPEGCLLFVAGHKGRDYQIYYIGRHASKLTNLSRVCHLYTLNRGLTLSPSIQSASFSPDSKWVAVVSHVGTTHIYAINPYGGPVTSIQQHSTGRKVSNYANDLFYRSAGLDAAVMTYRRHNPSTRASLNIGEKSAAVSYRPNIEANTQSVVTATSNSNNRNHLSRGNNLSPFSRSFRTFLRVPISQLPGSLPCRIVSVAKLKHYNESDDRSVMNDSNRNNGLREQLSASRETIINLLGTANATFTNAFGVSKIGYAEGSAPLGQNSATASLKIALFAPTLKGSCWACHASENTYIADKNASSRFLNSRRISLSSCNEKNAHSRDMLNNHDIHRLDRLIQFDELPKVGDRPENPTSIAFDDPSYLLLNYQNLNLNPPKTQFLICPSSTNIKKEEREKGEHISKNPRCQRKSDSFIQNSAGKLIDTSKADIPTNSFPSHVCNHGTLRNPTTYSLYIFDGNSSRLMEYSLLPYSGDKPMPLNQKRNILKEPSDIASDHLSKSTAVLANSLTNADPNFHLRVACTNVWSLFNKSNQFETKLLSHAASTDVVGAPNLTRPEKHNSDSRELVKPESFAASLYHLSPATTGYESRLQAMVLNCNSTPSRRLIRSTPPPVIVATSPIGRSTQNSGKTWQDTSCLQPTLPSNLGSHGLKNVRAGPNLASSYDSTLGCHVTQTTANCQKFECHSKAVGLSNSMNGDHVQRCDLPLAHNWISQIEMHSYTGPHRRLWMGPQISFKTFQPHHQTTIIQERSPAIFTAPTCKATTLAPAYNQPAVLKSSLPTRIRSTPSIGCDTDQPTYEGMMDTVEDIIEDELANCQILGANSHNAPLRDKSKRMSQKQLQNAYQPPPSSRTKNSSVSSRLSIGEGKPQLYSVSPSSLLGRSPPALMSFDSVYNDAIACSPGDERGVKLTMAEIENPNINKLQDANSIDDLLAEASCDLSEKDYSPIAQILPVCFTPSPSPSTMSPKKNTEHNVSGPKNPCHKSLSDVPDILLDENLIMPLDDEDSEYE